MMMILLLILNTTILAINILMIWANVKDCKEFVIEIKRVKKDIDVEEVK